jgi:tRNA A37 threonylcarbamoyladenosine dehydratase
MSVGSVRSPGTRIAFEGADALGQQEFYASFTARNRGLVSDDEQQMLRRAVILVAGCGSIGGAVVEPLVRLGAECLVLAEPDVRRARAPAGA